MRVVYFNEMTLEPSLIFLQLMLSSAFVYKVILTFFVSCFEVYLCVSVLHIQDCIDKCSFHSFKFDITFLKNN